MLQTSIMNFPRGTSGRRYSHLDLSRDGHHLRPRSNSIGVTSITESSPDLRSVGMYPRPPATPCTTPCFVSPRMAFSTLFSYDSPIQIITCAGGGAFKPVAKCPTRLLCTRRGLLLLSLFTLGVVLFLLFNGMDGTTIEEQCDAQDPTTLCHGHEEASPLQKFLEESSSWEQSPAHPQQDEISADQELENVETKEQRNVETKEERNNRQRMLTIEGRYEDSHEMDGDTDTSRDMNQNDDEGHSEERKLGELTELPREEREYLHRARRVVRDEDELLPRTESYTEDDPSMRVLTEEALPPAQQHPRVMEPESIPEALSHEYMHEEPFQREPATLEQLYMQQSHLESNYYHKEQQIVQQEIEAQEMRHRHQEQLWQEPRRQAHPRREGHHPQPHQRREHWEAGQPYLAGVPHQGEPGGMDARHPAWRDHQLHGQRLPRGVNPRRYYVHDDF